jgi:hypothetical protein
MSSKWRQLEKAKMKGIKITERKEIEGIALARYYPTADWLRFQRAVSFERLSGGMLDGDALKLEGHMRGVVFTIAKLSELSELERRVTALEKNLSEEAFSNEF